MNLVRKLVLNAAQHNFLCTASHVPGRDNAIGDALSRLQIGKFFRLAPHADRQPTQLVTLDQLTCPPVTI